MALYTYSKGLSDVDSTIYFPLSMIEVEIIFMHENYETRGGFYNRKTPMREESLRSPNPMLLYWWVVKSGTLFTLFEIAVGEMKYN